MAQNETGYYSESTGPVSSIEMLCGDTWNALEIRTTYIPKDELRGMCRYYAQRNPGVPYRFRYGTIRYEEEFEIVKVE